MKTSRQIGRLVGLAALIAIAGLGLSGCRGIFGRNTGPIDAFAFLPESNSQLSEPVQGAINNRPDPKEISLVVPPGTDLSRLVATITLNTEATITVISTGRRVPQTSLTPNNFSVPVTYAIELPGEDEPILYTVRVREASTNSRLIELSVEGSTYQRPTFGPNVVAYEAEVPFAASNVTVSARAEDPKAFAISINGVRSGTNQASSSVDFSAGDSLDVIVEVVAEDKTTRQDYVITIVRGEPDRNSSLTSLSIEGVTIDQVFRIDRRSYTATIPFSAQQLSIAAVPESQFASVTVNDVPTREGGAATVPIDDVQKQPVDVVVTAQDGSTSLYTITVTRAAPDANVNLASITSSTGDFSPVFKPEETFYSVTLPQNQESVSLNAAAQSNLSTVEANTDTVGVEVGSDGDTAFATVKLGEGENALVVFTVTSESGDTQDYRVVVRRDLGLASVVFTELAAEAVQLSPAFAPDVTEYSATVPSSVSSVKLHGTTFDPSLEVVVGNDVYRDQTVQIDVLLFEGATIKTPIRLVAPNGLERVYTVAIERQAGQSRIGRRILEVGMNDTRLPRREAATVLTSRAGLDTKATIRVRYHNETTVIYEGSAPVRSERTSDSILISMDFRSEFIDLDLSRYVDIEVSILLGDGRYLTYNTVAFADGNLDIRPRFMIVQDSPQMIWPAPGTLRPVSARVLYQLSQTARSRVEGLGDSFDVDANGEFETLLEIIDLETGEVIGKEFLATKPGSIHGRGIPSIDGMEFPEGTTLGYVLSARTRQGRLVRAHGTTQVRTLQTFDNGEWDFATVSIEADLELVDEFVER